MGINLPDKTGEIESKFRSKPQKERKMMMPMTVMYNTVALVSNFDFTHREKSCELVPIERGFFCNFL